MPRWLLPENIADALPSEARRIEQLRRDLLDLYRSYGYELVMPPLVEYLDSLLTGAGGELLLRTFKLVDQLSGRTLGVRADMTPQVARIDAHLLNRSGVARLCYGGSVLHARPAGHFASREPLQVGAEIYGHAGHEADLEVLELMIHSLARAGLKQVRVDLSHAAIVPALLAIESGLDEDELYPLLLRKDLPDLASLLASRGPLQRDALLALPGLYGPALGAQSVLTRARAVLPALPLVSAALDDLERICVSSLWRELPEVTLSIDLADLRGYRYHNGVSFAAYADAVPNSIVASTSVARGGRYDGVGAEFGRDRAATGFSLELRALAALASASERSPAISAPWLDDANLRAAIAALRASGEVVVQVMPGHEHEQQEFAFDRELVHTDGEWALRPISGI